MTPHHVTQACRRTQDALLIAQHKPSPKGQGGGSNTVEAPTPLPVTIISAKRELRDMLLDWCSLIRDGLDVVRTYDLDEHSMLDWIGSGERAEYIAAHDAGMDFLDELTTVTKQLENPYLPRAGKKYIGYHGGGDVYVRDGQTNVTLADGTMQSIDVLRTTNAQHVLEWTGTAKQVAQAIKDYFGHQLTPRQIADARNRDAQPGKGRKDGKLESIRTVGREHVYKVSDVLDRLITKENHTKS